MLTQKHHDAKFSLLGKNYFYIPNPKSGTISIGVIEGNTLIVKEIDFKSSVDQIEPGPEGAGALVGGKVAQEVRADKAEGAEALVGGEVAQEVHADGAEGAEALVGGEVAQEVHADGVESAEAAEESSIRFSVCGSRKDDDGADVGARAEMLAKKKEELIQLRKDMMELGASEDEILLMLKSAEEPSKLRITSDMKIILSDMDNKEVNMEPLCKAMYLLFLRHPEGIEFKKLSEYKDELRQIYCHLTKRFNLDKFFKSIEDLVNPFKNSVNEKCSRIHESFTKAIGNDESARPYIIHGQRGQRKSINLDRSLITWEEDE